MIALVDYGIGNLRSVEKALETVGADVRLTSDPEVVLAAEQVVLPGVGAFGDGMAGLVARGLEAPIRTVIERGVPLLGICVGMQLLFSESEELGRHKGLDILPGKVIRFPETGLKIPQTGWNQLEVAHPSPLLEGLHTGDYAYFNHSYYCAASASAHILARTDYGLKFPVVVREGPLYGVQFHPEKSQWVGLKILRNFVERCR
jgi:glutamine amidotransferase